MDKPAPSQLGFHRNRAIGPCLGDLQMEFICEPLGKRPDTFFDALQATFAGPNACDSQQLNAVEGLSIV